MESDYAASGGYSGSAGTSGADAAPDATLDVGTRDQQNDADGGSRNPLCGQGCNPDDGLACPGVAPGPDTSEQGFDAAGGDAFDAASLPPEAGPTDSGIRRDAEAGHNGCQVRRAGSSRLAICSPAGSGAPNAPCISSADCAAGLACVGDAKAALCRPYCCSESEATDGSDRDSGGSRCGAGEYCAERPLRDDADSADPLRVPVCVTAEKCLLSEPYPCPPEGACTCPEGTACTVVRNDGTTGCVEPPGKGVHGEACPCAAGHLCSSGTNRCLKLCLTTAPDCPTPVCQDLAGLPPDWGVCVGPMDGGNSR
jgi:hypothetical protein